MAKIVSHTWSSARGSIAGITYLTSPSGAIIARQRVKPVNPNSTNQVKSRMALAATAQKWVSLTDAEREAWDNAAGTTFTLLGRTMNTPGNGRALFMSSGSFINYLYSRSKVAAPFNGVAPNDIGIPQVQVQNIPYGGTVDSTGISLRLTNVSLARTMKIAAWQGVQVNQSRTYYRGPWRTNTLDILDLDDGATDDFHFAYSENPLEGQKLCIRLVPFYLPDAPFVGMVKGTEMIVADQMQTAEL